MSEQQKEPSGKEEGTSPRAEQRAGSTDVAQKAASTESKPSGFRFVVPIMEKNDNISTEKQGGAAVTGAKSVFAGEVERGEDGDGDTLGEEDASGAEWKPLVQLDLVQIKSGEEDEEVVAKFRAKLFRFDKAMREWKERGTGDIKFLKHRTTGRIRLLMRRQQTLKICANHYLLPEMRLEENMGSDRSWVWTAIDYADEERDEAVLAIRFKDSETAKRFHETFEDLRKQMDDLIASKKSPAKQPSDC